MKYNFSNRKIELKSRDTAILNNSFLFILPRDDYKAVLKYNRMNCLCGT